MVKADDIAAWFKGGRNYRAGVALLNKYGVDTHKLQPYTHNPIIPPFYADSLYQEIKKLAANDSLVVGCELLVVGDQNSSQLAVVSSEAQATNKAEEPQIIKDLRHKMRRLYDEYKSLHGQMKVAAQAGNESFERPRRILEIFEEIAPIGEHLKKWDEKGIVPAAEKIQHSEALVLLEKQKRLTYLNERISRYRNDKSKKKEIDALKIERDNLKTELKFLTQTHD